MKYLLTAIPVVLLLLFIGLWLKLHQLYRRRLGGKAPVGEDLSLEQLAAMKGTLSEEEYRRLRQSVVRTMGQDPQGETLSGEALSLEQLAAMKEKLSEEEYRRLRQTVVRKMTRGLDEGKSVSKQVSLAELEDQLRRQRADGQSSRAVE